MIRKILVLLVILFFSNIAHAGVYEDALAKNNYVFLYFYSPDCRTCNIFNPIFDNMKAKNKDYEFVKVNVQTFYGMRLLSKFKGQYIPYIILTNSKQKKSVNVNHTCVMDEVCLTRAMKSFNR